MCDAMQRAQKVLLCFPNSPEAAAFAIPTMKDMRAAFPNWRLTVCAAESANLADLRGVTIIRRAENSISYFGLPKKVFLQNLFQSKFDIVIDLGIEYDFTNLVLVWKSDAEMRIGFYHQGREDFYNFLLRQKNNATPEQAGQMLLNTLKAF